MEKLNISLGIETGIIKTVFQQRIFPGLHAQIVYPLLTKGNFSLSPAVDLNYNLLKIQQVNKNPFFYQEYRIGYDLKWGSRLKFIHSAGLGFIAEHYYGAYSQKYLTAIGLGYSVKMGCLYEF